MCRAKIARLRVGNGLDPEVEIGPLIHERQLRTVDAHVRDAVSRGARAADWRQRLPHLGPNFYAPTVLADVTHDMRVMREETFGPRAAGDAFDSDDDAVRMANDSRFWTGGQRVDPRPAARRAAGGAH